MALAILVLFGGLALLCFGVGAYWALDSDPGMGVTLSFFGLIPTVVCALVFTVPSYTCEDPNTNQMGTQTVECEVYESLWAETFG